jgi:hypothetical protein
MEQTTMSEDWRNTDEAAAAYVAGDQEEIAGAELVRAKQQLAAAQARVDELEGASRQATINATMAKVNEARDKIDGGRYDQVDLRSVYRAVEQAGVTVERH